MPLDQSQSSTTTTKPSWQRPPGAFPASEKQQQEIPRNIDNQLLLAARDVLFAGETVSMV
jgi:hypothetical protein